MLRQSEFRQVFRPPTAGFYSGSCRLTAVEAPYSCKGAIRVLVEAGQWKWFAPMAARAYVSVLSPRRRFGVRSQNASNRAPDSCRIAKSVRGNAVLRRQLGYVAINCWLLLFTACHEYDCETYSSCPKCSITRCCPQYFGPCTFTASDGFKDSSLFLTKIFKHCECAGFEDYDENGCEIVASCTKCSVTHCCFSFTTCYYATSDDSRTGWGSIELASAHCGCESADVDAHSEELDSDSDEVVDR